MKHYTKYHGRNGKRSLRKHRRGRKMMMGGYVNPNTQFGESLYVSTPNGIGASENGVTVNGSLNQQLQTSDSSTYAHSNAVDYPRINQFITNAAQTGASAMQPSQTGGGRSRMPYPRMPYPRMSYQNQYQKKNQYQNQFQNQFQKQNNRQYQNQNQNQYQRGGVWNQMIGDAVAPLVLLGLQQYYGPRSKSKGQKKSYKGKMTKKYRK